MLELNKIHCGDTRELLKLLPDESINCCVTSPPYWGLRDYGTDPLDWPEVSFSPMPGLPEIIVPSGTCSLGLEKDPWAFVGHMILIFRGLHRALRKDGILWLNFGDSYQSSNSAQVGQTKDKNTSRFSCDKRPPKSKDLKPKDLVGIPWRVAFALQADGWYLRQDIIWAKPNPMPESVTDRCTKSHEYFFLLSKSAKYYYDHEAIKEPVAESTIGRGPVSFGGQKGREYTPDPTDPNFRNGHEQWGRTFDYTKSCTANGKHSVTDKNSPGRRMVENTKKARLNGGDHDSPFGFLRNKRSVWTVATKPFKKAHFATFPPKLIEPCILAGCPKGGTVVDIFCGSGTVPFVARENNRNWIGFDLSETYIEDIANPRIKNAQPKLF